MTTSRQEAERRLISDISSQGTATAAEFNIDAITNELYNLAGSWNFDVLDADVLWLVVKRHAHEAITSLGEYPSVSFIDRVSAERLAGLISFFESDGVDRQTAIDSLRRVVAGLT